MNHKGHVIIDIASELKPVYTVFSKSRKITVSDDCCFQVNGVWKSLFEICPGMEVMTANGPSMIVHIKGALSGVCYGFMTDRMSNILINGFYIKTAHCEPSLKKDTIARIKERLYRLINPQKEMLPI